MQLALLWTFGTDASLLISIQKGCIQTQCCLASSDTDAGQVTMPFFFFYRTVRFFLVAECAGADAKKIIFQSIPSFRGTMMVRRCILSQQKIPISMDGDAPARKDGSAPLIFDEQKSKCW